MEIISTLSCLLRCMKNVKLFIVIIQPIVHAVPVYGYW